MKYLALLVLSVSAMAFTSNACQFGSEGIQAMYDRFQLFKNTKAFDPTDSTIPLEQYQFYTANDGEKTLSLKINGVYMTEFYTTDGDNKIVTKRGQYEGSGAILNYERDENGEFSFDDLSNRKKFSSSLRSIDADLPSDFEADYKNVLVDLNAMRTKMFDFQKGLSQEDLERVMLFDVKVKQFVSGSIGFSAQYSENDRSGLSVTKENRHNVIYGRYSCDYKHQKYNIVDGRVVVDGEPFVPVYD